MTISDNVGWPNFDWAVASTKWFGVTNKETGVYTEVIDATGNVSVGTVEVEDWAVTNAKLAVNSVSLENLDSWITPSSVVVYSGETTWTGGLATLAITVNGALATDIVTVTIQSAPSEAAYIASTSVTANTVTVALSTANTSNNAVIAYQVIRVVS